MGARGPARAPTQNAFRGQVGATRTRTVHLTTTTGDLAVAQVHVAVDVSSDPELGRRLLSDDPQRGLNTIRLGDGALIRVDVPVVYHDSSNELFVLVLGDGDRHRELSERARLLGELAAEAVPVPAYVRDFAVVFGVAGLRQYLETRAEQALERARAGAEARELETLRGQLERRRAELSSREAETERLRADTERLRADTERLRAEVERVRGDVDRRTLEIAAQRDEVERKLGDAGRLRGELERARAEVERVRAELEAVRSEAQKRPEPRPERSDSRSDSRPDARAESSSGRAPSRAETEPPFPDRRKPEPPRPRGTPPLGVPAGTDSATDPVAAPRAAAAAAPGDGEELTSPGLQLHGHLAPGVIDEITNRFALSDEPLAPELPAGADPMTTEQRDVPAVGADVWLDGFTAGTATWAVSVDEVGVRLALRGAGATAAALSRSALDLRLQMVRTDHGPRVALTIGAPHALRGAGAPLWISALLDPAADPDRAALAALARDFTITVDLVEGSRRVRRSVLNAPLAENAAYLARTADAHRRGDDGSAATDVTATDVTAAGDGLDVLGRRHPEASEFRDDKLRQLSTAGQVRRAVAIARRFARPASEDYLVCVRGYPLSRWRQLRRAVLERAVAWGLWFGTDLAQVAVSEGLARSRKDLVQKMTAAFARTAEDPAIGDLDDDAADDNRKALADEAQALGMGAAAPAPSHGPGRAILSELAPVVSGTIDRGPTPVDPRTRTVDDLVALLDDRHHRLAAAVELCDRADPRGIRPVLAAVRRMSRAEAVRVLGAAVRFGPAAAPALTAGLASSKAFLRHGCALALAMLRTAAGTDAVIELLLSEPTEIWREVARAVGQVGPAALGPLAARLSASGGADTGHEERIAWAMAHIGVRGGKSAVEALAAGASPVAPAARAALTLMAPAARDQVRIRAGDASDEVREITVNRAFSRRFFEAADDGQGGQDGQGGEPARGDERQARERSGAMELPSELLAELPDGVTDGSGEILTQLIDDSDVIEASDLPDEAELDETDLLPT